MKVNLLYGGKISNLLVFAPKGTMYFWFQILFKSVVLSSDDGVPSVGCLGGRAECSPSVVVWILSTHTSDNCVLSCFLPMSVHFLQYLHPPTLHLAGLKITVKSDRHTLVTQY